MGDWSKIIYDKMPMFYGQILLQKYLLEPAISICAIGDHISDECPLQVSNFSQGMDIDNLIAKLYLESGGGGSFYESYELGAYFYTMRTVLQNTEIPFFFLTGDEAYYEVMKPEVVKKIFYTDCKNELKSRDRFGLLKKKYNVFLIKKPYEGPNEVKILEQWNSTLGNERVLMINNPKACIDVMLGAIALTTGARDLDGYIEDMRTRGQTDERINEVKGALKLYNESIAKKTTELVIGETSQNIHSNLDSFKRTDFKEIQTIIDQIAKEDSKPDPTKERQDMHILKNSYKNDVPNEFLCPITEEIFTDPVMTCDGHTYERKAIEAWLNSHDNSPVTNLPLSNKNLMPNVVLKNLIKGFHKK